MIRRKKLPQKKQEGLCIYCSDPKCKKYFFSTHRIEKKEDGTKKKMEVLCKKDNVLFSNCKSFHKHRFMARFQLPNSNGVKVSKVLDTNKYEEAVIKTVEFKQEIIKEILSITPESDTTGNSGYLHDAQIRYLEFLENIDVPEHQQVKRSEKHIGEQFKCLKLFNESLQKNNVNKKSIPIHKISDTHVGYFHNFLLKDKEYANKTYNNKVSALKSFMEWAIEYYDLPIKNPFTKVKQRSTKTNKATITGEEFNALINPKHMCTENGHVVVGKKKQIKRNLYRDYLADGIELCLHTGGRREEVVELQWNMVHKINGEIAYIEFNNLKVERMLGEGYNDNVNTNIIPITKDLKKLLLRLGYNKQKNSSEYILCPDRTNQSTQTIMDNLSKGFTHFYKQLNTGRHLQMKCLRKTYLTYLKLTLQGDMKKLDSHSTDAVLDKHYIDEKIVSKAVAEMSIFGDK